MELLKSVLTTTYFSLRGKIYQQNIDTAMRCPVFPIVANLCMEFLKQHAISTVPATDAPRLWRRHVDDSLEIIKKGQLYNLTLT